LFAPYLYGQLATAPPAIVIWNLPQSSRQFVQPICTAKENLREMRKVFFLYKNKKRWYSRAESDEIYNFLCDIKIIFRRNNEISKKNIIFAVVYTHVIWKLKN